VTKKHVHKQQQTLQSRWPWLGPVAALLFVVIGGMVVWNVWGKSPAAPLQITGAPRLAVAQAAIDEGNIKLGQTVRSIFRLQNVGDQPLQILGEPAVEVIEGC
jgi:hypothetical protein